MSCPHGYENADFCPGCRAESEAMRLRAENDRLRLALAEIAERSMNSEGHRTVAVLGDMARKALEGA